MGVLSTIYKLNEATITELSAYQNFKFFTPYKQQFGLSITDLSEKILNANTLVLWNFGDPFANEIDGNPNEVRTNSVLDIIPHQYKYAGLYTITAIIYIDNYVFHLIKTIDIPPDNYDFVMISPAPGTYNTNQLVRWFSYDPGFQVFYTDDGSDPKTSSTVKQFIEPITLLADSSYTKTINYYSVLSSGKETDTQTAVYKMRSQIASINISPSASKQATTFNASLNYDSEYYDAYYYTNTDPTPVLYTTAFNVNTDTTIHYYLTDKGQPDSTYPEEIQIYSFTPFTFDFSVKPATYSASTSAMFVPGVYPDVWMYQWKLDDGAWSGNILPVSGNTFENLVFTNLNEGLHTLYFKAADAQGLNWTPEYSYIWVADTVAPL